MSRGTPSFLLRKVWIRLGEWSFALYITHMFVLRLFTRAFSHSQTASPGVWAAIELLFVVTAVGVSIPVYYPVGAPPREAPSGRQVAARDDCRGVTGHNTLFQRR